MRVDSLLPLFVSFGGPLPRSSSSSTHLELNSGGRSPSNSRFDENSRPDPVIRAVKERQYGRRPRSERVLGSQRFKKGTDRYESVKTTLEVS